uniref:YIP1 family protein n=1 Tax=candidate division WOR-3 bacterium TaxID=2052148 RepID=A0A7V1EHH6_UNCW3
MKNIINIFTNPSTVFISVKEKPEWFKPLIVVLILLSLISVFTISTSKDLIDAQQIEAMQKRNMTEEQIEQAMKFASGPIIYVSAIFGTFLGTAGILLIFALLLNIFIPMIGGEGSYKLVFSVVSFSALIKIPAHLLRWILVMLKHSLEVSTSLALFLPSLGTNTFAYRFLSNIDFFIIWEMLLVALGISITNNLKRKNAYILVFAIWFASVVLSVGLGQAFGPK